MNEFCVALLQLLPEETQEGNLQKGLEACRRAKAMGRTWPCFQKFGTSATAWNSLRRPWRRRPSAWRAPFYRRSGALRRRWTWPSPLPTWSGLPPCPGTP